MKKSVGKKMQLSTETLRHLADTDVQEAAAGNGSNFNSFCTGCSIPGGPCGSVTTCTDPRVCH